MKRNNLIHLSAVMLLMTSCDAVINSTENKVKKITEEGYDGAIEEAFGLDTKSLDPEQKVDFSSAKPVKASELFELLPMSFDFSGLTRTYKRQDKLEHTYQEDSPNIEVRYDPVGELDEDFMHVSTLTIQMMDGAKQADIFNQGVANLQKDFEYQEDNQSIRHVNKNGHRVQEIVVTGNKLGVSLSYIKQNRYAITITGQNTLNMKHLYAYLDALEKINFPQ